VVRLLTAGDRLTSHVVFTVLSWPGLSRASRSGWHSAYLIEIAGTSPAM
jgi:hypothetical protein